MGLHVVILAAGKGTRMRSDKPKVLHEIAGKPMLHYVIETAQALHADQIHVVHGHGGDQVKQVSADYPVNWVEQAQQKGTGHAVQQAMPHVPDNAGVLVLYGDVPLTQSASLQPLIDAANEGDLALLTAVLDDATGYGRIVRNADDHVRAIVEHKDAADDELAIREINTGMLAAPAGRLRDWLSRINDDNAQGELYLTDIVGLAVADGVAVQAAHPQHAWEGDGVNSRQDQARLERIFQGLLADQLMADGVTVADPARLDIRGNLRCGRDVFLDVNTLFLGDVELGDGVSIGPNTIIDNCRVADGVHIRENCVLEKSIIGKDCTIGPFSRVRPESDLAANVHLGNFVELKKAKVAEGSKINHLSYVGDSIVGRDVNIGAGTITCNYDGANKHLTEIGDDVFVGSDTQLVAPVKVGKGVTIGAGTTVTRDIPDDLLCISRVPQKHIKGWQRPRKKGN